jgi:hypothetical protein
MRVRRTIPLVAVAALAAVAVACVPPTPPNPGEPATTGGTPAPTSPPQDTTTVPTTVAATTTTLPDGIRHGTTPVPGFWRVQMPSTPDTRAVYASVVYGGVLYLGGQFTTLASPDGTQTKAVSNLAAINLSTGLPVDVPSVEGSTVEALVVGGNRLYLGGQFNKVGGENRSNLAAIDLGTHAVSAGSLTPNAGGKVWALEASATHVYVGGDLASLGGVAQQYLARFAIGSGAVDTGFAPGIAGGRVRGLDLTADGSRLYASGQFTSVGGNAGRPMLASLNPTTGAWSGPAVWADTSKHVREASAGLQDVAVSPDGTRVFAGAMGSWNSVVAWGTADGRRAFQCRTKGNVQAVAISNGDVYFGFHDGFELYDGPLNGPPDPDEVIDGKIKVLRIPVNAVPTSGPGISPQCAVIESNVSAGTDPVTGLPVSLIVPRWRPSIDNQVWSITSDGSRVIVTGDFSKVWEGDTQNRDAQRYAGFVVFD